VMVAAAARTSANCTAHSSGLAVKIAESDKSHEVYDASLASMRARASAGSYTRERPKREGEGRNIKHRYRSRGCA